MPGAFEGPFNARRSQPRGLQHTSSRTSRRRFAGIAALAGSCLLAWSAAPAQAATLNLYAAPSAAGAGDCSSPADACSIETAVTNANAASLDDQVRIALAGGDYQLPAPSPTALVITFEGPRLTLEAAGGTPTLDGEATVRLLSVGATSKVTIDGLAFESGSTAGLGGAIENSGELTVRNSTFSGNTAANGGAIANVAGGTLEVESSTFSQNATTGVGGGAIISFGPATVKRSAIVDNEVPINGGGINIQPGGEVKISNSTVAGNTSGGFGGGISNLGTLTVQSSTIAGNTGTSGEAIASGNSNVTLAASILAAPSPSDGTCNPANAGFTDGGYNLDDDGTCISPDSPATGSHNGTTAHGSSTYGEVLDAYLADGPADNGGPTPTIALLNSPSPSTALANPAFDVVPPSFELPFPVDGTSAACSLSDQRGVMPAAGANCGIGAYLLQATKTSISAARAKQNAQVTFTATVTPAPTGGTVSFDDGAGNPATARCGSLALSPSGTATCTVSYANIGGYPVAASYSGDGAANNFAPSAAAPRTTTVIDGIPPSALKKLKSRIQGKTLRLSWAASSDNVAVTRYRVRRHGKVIKVIATTQADVRSVSIPLTGKGGVYAVRAVDRAGNVGALSKRVDVRLRPQRKPAYRIVKRAKR